MKRFFILILIVIWALPLFAKGGDTKKTPKKQLDDSTLYRRSGLRSEAWNELVEEGMEAISGDNLATGVLLLGRAVEKGCKDPLVNFKLGQYYESKEDLNKALEFYKKALGGIFRHYPRTDYANSMYETYGRVLFSLNKYDEAKSVLLEAVKQNPKAFTPLFLLGQIAKSEGDTASVIDYFSRAMEAPLPADTTTNIPLVLSVELAEAYYKSGDFDNALTFSNQALSLVPNHPVALKIKNRIEQERQRVKERELIKQIIQ